MAKKEMVKLGAAILISFTLVSAMAVFFIRLSEAGKPSTPFSDVRDTVIALDGSVWQTDKDGRKLFAEAFGHRTDGSLSIRRSGDDTLIFSFGSVSVAAGFCDGYLSGFLGDSLFTVHISESRTGEGESLSILSGETVIVYSAK